jgi:hypothetical protein
MEKQKSVTIKETLFMDLVKYFLVNVREDEDRIRLELQKKTGCSGKEGTIYEI